MGSDIIFGVGVLVVLMVLIGDLLVGAMEDEDERRENARKHHESDSA